MCVSVCMCKIFRSGDEKEEKKVAREDDDERGRREKLVYVPCTYFLPGRPCAYLQTRALSRLESEKDDYLHRDTSSLNRPVYLLIYLSVSCALFHRCVFSFPLSFFFFFHFYSLLLARERFRTGVKKNCQYRERA